MIRLFVAAFAGLALGVALSATMLDNGVDAAISLQCGMSLVALVCVFGLYWATRAAKDYHPRPSSRRVSKPAGGGRILYVIVQYPRGLRTVSTRGQIAPRGICFCLN